MIQLLTFIVSVFATLFEKHQFYIKQSSNSGNRFHGSSILLSSADVEVFTAIERDEITVCFRSTHDRRQSNWYSAELILSLLGHPDCPGVMNEQNSGLLRDALPEILHRFRTDAVGETLSRLDEIKRRRNRKS